MKSGSIRRNYLLGVLAVAAISTFMLALPGTAFACIAESACTGGTVVIGGYPVCSGGAFNGQQICSGTTSTSSAPSKPFSMAQRDHFQPYNMEYGSYLGSLGRYSVGTGYLNLGMYVSSNGGMSGDAGFAGGGYSLRNSGVSITDTAGLIAPGTNSPSYHENGGVGGLSGTYDASRFVGPNQKLLFNG